jgi:succinoglycan biosynthesis protein ExoO
LPRNAEWAAGKVFVLTPGGELYLGFDVACVRGWGIMNRGLAPDPPLNVSKDDTFVVPEVSFIMAARNVEPYVEAALLSALRQTVQNIEIVVVDDSSSDSTAEKIAALAKTDPRISLIACATSIGPSAARNLAIAAARGKWIAILDADDLIAPERTEYMLSLARSLNCDIIADNSLRFADQSGICQGCVLESGQAKYGFLIGAEDYLGSNHIFSKTAALGYLKPIFRTAFLKENEIQYDETLVVGEDFFFCLDSLMRGARYLIVSEGFYFYRIRAHSTSRTLRRQDIERLIAACKMRFLPKESASASGIAAGRYRAALDRALIFTNFVHALKSGDLKEVLRIAALRPDIWPLLRRFGTEAVVKRLARRKLLASGGDRRIDLTNLSVEREIIDSPLTVSKIAICICTYRRRDGLRTLLDAIDGQQMGSIDPDNVVIIVVESDDDQSAASVCADYAERGRFRLHVLHEANTTLCNVRNVALDAARDRGSNHAVFVDDDTIPSRKWLVHLVMASLSSPVAAVLGPVYPLFQAKPPRWAITGGFFSLCKEHFVRRNGAIRSGSTSNALLSMAAVNNGRLRFDARANRAHGEDLFFRSLLDEGSTIGWSEDAVVWKIIPAPQMTLQSLLRRWYRSGRLDAQRGTFNTTTLLGRFAKATAGIVRIGLGGALAILASLLTGWWGPSAIIARLNTVSRGAGLLAAAFTSRRQPRRRTR